MCSRFLSPATYPESDQRSLVSREEFADLDSCIDGGIANRQVGEVPSQLLESIIAKLRRERLTNLLVRSLAHAVRGVSMDPEIRYARNSDGTNIAHWAIGSGRTLVYMPPMPWCHLEREWLIPPWRRRYERLAAGRQVVRYDARGFGLSDPSPSVTTLAAHVADLEAVLDTLDVSTCDLFAPGDAGLVAVAFSAAHPARVERLILWNSYARRAAFNNSAKVKSMRVLWDQDWRTYTESMMGTFFHWKHGDRSAQLADLYRAAATPESVRDVIGALYDVDVTPLLAGVATPTMVVAVEDFFEDMTSESRHLAAGLPNAQLRTVSAETGYFDFYDEEEDPVVTVVSDYLDDAETSGIHSGNGVRVAHSPGRGVQTVLFTDIVGHTEMMHRLGDLKGRDVLREHERITRATLALHGGAEVKTMGDGFMAAFGSVSDAVDCAVALQRAFAAHTGSMSEPLHVRVGLNAGEPIEEDGDLFGATVIIAARISARAEAGEILVPDSVRGLLSGKRFNFIERDEFTPKGFNEAIRLYEVDWRE